MQNFIKTSGKVMLLACMALMLLTACSQKSKLKLAIEAASKQCPMSMGTAGEVTDIDFDGKDVIYSLSMNEDYVNLDALEKNPAAMKSGVTAMFNNPKGEIKTLLELMVASEAGVKYRYKGQTSGKEIEFYLSTEDLKDLLNKDMSQEESDRKKLEELVNVTNVSCPTRVDETTVLDNLTIESDNVVYNYTVDEKAVDMDTMEENLEAMKQSIKGALNVGDPAIKTFLQACAADNKNLVYRYKGDTSGKTVDCVLEVSEIKEML